MLLPLAHVTTLAGSITLIGTSSNLVIAGMAEEMGVTMGMFSFAPVALPVALVGWAVIYVTAPRLVKKMEKRKGPEKEWRVEMPVSSSALATNRVAADMGLAKTPQYTLTGIERWGETLPPDTPIEPEDVLVFAATEAGVAALWGSPLFGLSPDRLYAVSVKVGESGTLHAFEQGDNLKVIAARTGKPLCDTELIPGETCYVAAAGPQAIAQAKDSPVALWQDAASRVPQPGQTWKALVILAAVILSATFGLAPVELAATAGALLADQHRRACGGHVLPREERHRRRGRQPRCPRLGDGHRDLGRRRHSRGEDPDPPDRRDTGPVR